MRFSNSTYTVSLCRYCAFLALSYAFSRRTFSRGRLCDNTACIFTWQASSSFASLFLFEEHLKTVCGVFLVHKPSNNKNRRGELFLIPFFTFLRNSSFAVMSTMDAILLVSSMMLYPGLSLCALHGIACQQFFWLSFYAYPLSLIAQVDMNKCACF